MQVKDGGPAFGHGDPTHGGDQGMSLRDWFAGQALVLLKHSNATNEIVADHAYAIADALLTARSQEKE
jgi:hypothetical protein